jgi:predicted metal-dependent hydrolase
LRGHDVSALIMLDQTSIAPTIAAWRPHARQRPNAPTYLISAPYLGRDYRIQIAEADSGEIEFSHVFIVPPAQQAKRRQVLRDWYIERAKEKILGRVRQHGRTLGVKLEGAKIVENRYRWGSCTVKNNVSFNWRLIKAPMFVIDYVVIHELAHLIEANHTPRFWSIVRAHTSTMEKAKAWFPRAA